MRLRAGGGNGSVEVAPVEIAPFEVGSRTVAGLFPRGKMRTRVAKEPWRAV